MAKFNGWYFEYTVGYICIVSKDYWDANWCLSDTHIESELGDLLPDGIFEVNESMFETIFPKKETVRLLKDAGFKEMKLIDED